MRITNSMMVKKFLSESNKALNRVAKYQSQVDSTKRISGIADDPQATMLALKARNKLSNLELYMSNIRTAGSYLTEAESSVSGLNEVLKSAYENIISAQSGSKTPEDLKVLAEELKNLQAEVLSIGNTSLGTSYVFGGFNYTGSLGGSVKKPPFEIDSVTGDLIYNGINLSRISWKEDFDAGIARMTDQLLTRADHKDLRSVAEAYSADYAGYSDTFAKDRAQEMLESLETLLSGAKNALTAAEEYGINAAQPEFTALKGFYDDLSAVATELSTEISKEVPGSYIRDTDVPAEHRLPDGSIDYDYYREQGISVYTEDELDHLKFNKQTVYDILNYDATTVPPGARPHSLFHLLTGSPSPMTTAIQALSGVVTTPVNATNFDASIKEMTDQFVTSADGSDLMSRISAYNVDFSSYSDNTARIQSQAILGSMKSILSGARSAMAVAEAYGVDPASAEYVAFETYYDNLSAVTDELTAILDSGVFDKNAVHDLLNYDVTTMPPGLRPYSALSLLTGSPSPMTAAIDTLSGVVEAPMNTVDLITEGAKKTTLQIGTSQTVDITLTGLELFGTGNKNVYHILGKAISLLENGADPDELSRVITALQDAQSADLTLQTKIGATRNRLSLISDRYVSSELNYTQMRSDAEDVDMAEAIMNLTTAQSVYNAALAGGAEILRTSLIDFLR